MKKRFILGLLALLLISGAGGWMVLKYRWKDILAPVTFMAPYALETHHADTLQVLMIGDSWAGMHHDFDTVLYHDLANILTMPVRVKSMGRGGAKSKEIYYLMCDRTASPSDLSGGYGIQKLLKQGADYCVVMAGINDAAANLGIDYYCRNLQAVVDFLIHLKIKPVIMEMPFVDIRGLYRGKPLHDKLVDWFRSLMTQCRMYDVEPYSQAMLAKFQEMERNNEVVIVRKNLWNEKGCRDERGLYLQDRIHLNSHGYTLLDSCLAVAISEDWLRNRSH